LADPPSKQNNSTIGTATIRKPMEIGKIIFQYGIGHQYSSRLRLAIREFGSHYVRYYFASEMSVFWIFILFANLV